MNRTLKFRAWDSQLKKWLHNGVCLNLNGTVYDMCSEGPDAHTIMQQYTGLKDKNDVEIYEGDIVEWKNNFTGEICWSEEEVAFVLRSYTGGYSLVNKTYKDRFEIIGNIFENKDLLKV